MSNSGPSQVVPAESNARVEPGLDDLIDEAANILAGRRVAVLTGAGISTDSGIPDYRGEGAIPRSPMTFSQFLNDAEYRRRYWAGSQLGWQKFSSVAPNAGHRVLARLEEVGVVAGIMTQNVDGLHQRAGSHKVVELHGSADRVRCLTCGQFYARVAIAEVLASENPWLAEVTERELGPDGDVQVTQLDQMVVPGCSVCGGLLRPDIVYFGEFIPATKFSQARGLVRSADALLITGSSLVVNSGIRLLDQAERSGIPIVIVNRGETRGDSRATLKIDAGASPVLTALAERLIR